MWVKPQHVAADLAEAVDVVFTRRSPIDKLDPELEGRLALADHLQRVDAGECNEVADVGNSRLAYPDRSDLVGFDQPDLDLAQPLREHRGGHPSGRAAADDRHFADGLRGTCQMFLPPIAARNRLQQSSPRPITAPLAPIATRRRLGLPLCRKERTTLTKVNLAARRCSYSRRHRRPGLAIRLDNRNWPPL